MGVNGVTPAEPLAFSFSAKWKEESGAVRGGWFFFFCTPFPFSSEARPEDRPPCLLQRAAMPQPRPCCSWGFVNGVLGNGLTTESLGAVSPLQMLLCRPHGAGFVSSTKQVGGPPACQSQERQWLPTALGYLVFNLRTMQVHLNTHCLLVSLLSKQVKTSGSVLSPGFIFIVSSYNGTLSI